MRIYDTLYVWMILILGCFEYVKWIKQNREEKIEKKGNKAIVKF